MSGNRILAKIPMQWKAVVPVITVASVMNTSGQEAAMLPAYHPVTPTQTVSVQTNQTDETDSPSTSYTELSIPVMPSEWTKGMQKEYERLSRLEALGKISDREMRELERLSHYRRALVFPRSSEEVLHELKDQKLTNDLVAALNAYVKFHSSNSPR